MHEYSTLLLKCITLLYRQSLIENGADNDGLIRTILDTINTDQPELNFNGHNSIKSLKSFILQMLNKEEDCSKEIIISRVKLILEVDDRLYSAIEQGINAEYDEGTNKRVVISLVKYLGSAYREHLITNLINRANYDIKFNKAKITNIYDYVNDLITKLEPLTNNSTIKDPALMDEIDLYNEESLNNVFSNIKKSANGSIVFKTGWQAFNTMLQGGFRRGEFTTIAALQHKYKTGFTLSIFMQIALHNKPVMLDATKKPLLLRISFEDSILNNLQFMYQYLRVHDNNGFTEKELETTDIKDMSKYVTERLTVNGFHIKMLRVDPTQWSYKDICNKVIEMESLGYEVQVLMLDYLALVPTTGCTMGVIGGDRRDQFRRVRNFCCSKNISVITPHQLSSESKQIIRAGIVPEAYFVKEITEKGYYDGCKTLDQEIDLEIYIHLFNYKRKTFLAVQRGKHRLTTNIDQDDKYFMLPFINKDIPLLEDLNGNISSIKILPKEIGTNSNSAILNEILGS